ncbi:hypothetical protein [Sphingopyxis granuli]|uniref:Uncharacterized protein n=1 Tax=Sphingopyxis granuli TaxID=267128 RepID=A0AA86GNI1_9SPHN|nr:hypothetical protein [Sphingopyxis granuli]AMG75461.1 Uncharacterized protein SGRAN_3115 [Sphingopyxis granuli]
MTSVPPITDRLPIAVRAFAGPRYIDLSELDDRKPKRGRSITPASEWTLIFDTETTADAAQALRFGAYQFRKLDELDEAGIFYDPDCVTAAELECLSANAEAHRLRLRTRDEFVDEVFFAHAFALRARIVGFNLPFDISRLAIKHGSARTPMSDDNGMMRGGFTFKLSRQKIYPNIRVKHMSRRAASIAFAAIMAQRNSRSQRKRGQNMPVRRGHFLDVKTLAGALFARNFSLASLCDFLKVEHPKLDFDDFSAPINDEMIRYGVADVQATWECYRIALARFDQLELTDARPEKIYSEASIGKAYLKAMGIQPWRKMQPDFPRNLLAKIMGSYFGGRSEVRIRRELRQVMLCDFLSMYPTVCTLMRLWDFVIADGMTWHDATDETRSLLARIDLADLQSPDIWQAMTVLVRVMPDGDIFPVRADYAEQGQNTIGLNHLSSDTPLWFTLADCIASMLLSGKAPVILEAIRFAPGPVQPGLAAININGNPAYRVDPNETDFFKRVIELRQTVKQDRDDADDADREALDIEQNALKIAANATSYGIWVEVNVDERPKPSRVTVHNSTGEPFSFSTDRHENPGTYFHPLLATLITGAARLMLAITERLVTDAGLDWSFCDTDSMAIAKPDAMSSNEFTARVKSVAQWFDALNPYDFAASILKIEDVNYSLETGELEPLFCLAISSKRYALFNLNGERQPIMRKVSAHGLGHLMPPYDDADAPKHFPVPDKSVLKDGTVRWHCDLWHQIVSAVLAGRPDRVARDYHPAMNGPARSRYAATSPDLLRWFKFHNANRDYRDQVRPFGFMLSYGIGLVGFSETIVDPSKRGRPKKVAPIKPIAPFEKNGVKAAATVFDRETGKSVDPAILRTYAEALAQYHISPEVKFLNGNFLDKGTTLRRHIAVPYIRYIGKEADDWERRAALGQTDTMKINYGVSDADRSRAEAQTGIARVEEQAEQARNREAELAGLRDQVAAHGLRPTARALGVDPSNLRRRLLYDVVSSVSGST